MILNTYQKPSVTNTFPELYKLESGKQCELSNKYKKLEIHLMDVGVEKATIIRFGENLIIMLQLNTIEHKSHRLK